ncbi:hypothetical protein DFH28DRAFT_914010 [Melampsora americana]|nr:hypothetical protein DFH28DRAFT_914010 [Melampsora americana]
MYQNDTGSPFKDISCYNIVKDTPKWQQNPAYVEHCGNSNGSSVHSAINLGSDLDSLPKLERPIGSKQAKRGRSNIAEELIPQLLENQSKILQTQSSAAESNKELALQGKAAQESLQTMVDWTILTTNLSTLDDVARAEIEARRTEVIRRSRARREAE